jgi:hypothetical protein
VRREPADLTGSESIASVAGYCPKYSALADQALQ